MLNFFSDLKYISFVFQHKRKVGGCEISYLLSQLVILGCEVFLGTAVYRVEFEKFFILINNLH